MWTCKHCKGTFNFIRTTEKANHSRWCKSNPRRDESRESLSKAASDSWTRRLGPIKSFTVECGACGGDFQVEERESLFPSRDTYYCSRSCACSVGGKVHAETVRSKYRSIALNTYGHKCMICGFDSVVEVHHVDENRENNNPENLAVLCPNHHYMIHRGSEEQREEVSKLVQGVVAQRGER